jgi:hypothetical protein
LKIDLGKLLVSQEELRDVQQVVGMVRHVYNHGLWTQEVLDKFSPDGSNKLIAVTRFPDDKLLLHDGHHRLFATLLAGRRVLMPEEYVLTDRQYADYLEINFKTGWLTPFCPMKEIRIADFINFKREAAAIVAINEERAKSFIVANRQRYVRLRTLHTLEDLVKRYENELKRQDIWQLSDACAQRQANVPV